MVGGVNTNQLIAIGPGFTTAMANLDLNVQLAQGHPRRPHDVSLDAAPQRYVGEGRLSPGRRVAVGRAAAERHHEVPHASRVGQFEVNYGDAHFRRTDGGNGMDNPFIGNLIMDAFTTEIGADATFRRGGWMAMAGFTGGTSDGQVTSPGQHQPAYLGKSRLRQAARKRPARAPDRLDVQRRQVDEQRALQRRPRRLALLRRARRTRRRRRAATPGRATSSRASPITSRRTS